MSDPNQFGWRPKYDGADDHAEACPEWAERLPDAADGLLSDAQQLEVERHVLTCAGCARELADAQRGAAWLAFLKEDSPEPPVELLSAILEKTLGADPLGASRGAAAAAIPEIAGTASPAWVGASVEARPAAAGVWGRIERWLGIEGAFASILQPRLAMTSAMAFLSVCLTFNLLGVSVRNLSTASLSPGELQRTVADTGASLVRSFEGIRMVYRVESRVNEWRTATWTPSDANLGLSH